MADWFCRSAATGTAAGTSWTNAKTTLSATLTGAAAGDRVWVADDHNESTASAITLTSPGTISNPCFIYSVDHTIASPGTGNLKSDPYNTGTPACARVTTTGASNITMAGIAYCFGIVFYAGSGATAAGIVNSGPWTLDSCSLRHIATTGNTAAIQVNSDAPVFINTTVQFSSTLDRISFTNHFQWLNTNVSSAILGATIPTSIFRSSSSMGIVEIDSVDLSALTGSLFLAPTTDLLAEIRNCNMGSGFTIFSANPTVRKVNVLVTNSDSSATNYRQQQDGYFGSLIQDTTVIRTGGTSDGTTAWSWLLTSKADVKWVYPFETFPLPVWNATTAADVTVTLHGIINAAAVPNNDDIWARVIYPGSASFPLGTFKTNTKANNLATGTALTADTTAQWDSNVAARVNSATYSIGQTIKVASNAGRVFFCTTGGAASASEPAGYASAVDGGSVTDGAAVFRAGCRFSMAVTLTSPQPQMAGPLRISIFVAKASTSYYIDPTA
jgi:hypothetical protein